MEMLQLAQMLADLSNLEEENPQSAKKITTANKTIASCTLYASNSSQHTQLSQQVAATVTTDEVTPSFVPRSARTTGASTPFDSYFGRRLLPHPISASNSLPGTPRGEADSDVERASSLIALYELRSKLKEYYDGNNLQVAREKIVALNVRQNVQQRHAQDPTTRTASKLSATVPTTPIPASTQSLSPGHPSQQQFTYPRS